MSIVTSIKNNYLLWGGSFFSTKNSCFRVLGLYFLSLNIQISEPFKIGITDHVNKNTINSNEFTLENTSLNIVYEKQYSNNGLFSASFSTDIDVHKDVYSNNDSLFLFEYSIRF